MLLRAQDLLQVSESWQLCELLYRTRLVWISEVKVRDDFLGVFKVVPPQPRGCLVRVLITGPFDEVSKWRMLEPFVDFGVQNLIDFVLQFSIDLDWHWGWFISTREVVSEHRLQHADMEYWVDSPEFVREFQHVV